MYDLQTDDPINRYLFGESWRGVSSCRYCASWVISGVMDECKICRNQGWWLMDGPLWL